MGSSLKLPPKMELHLVRILSLSRYGYHFMAVSFIHGWMLSLMQAYLGRPDDKLEFRQWVDAVESDRLGFRGKAEILRRLRRLDALVERASSAHDYEEANRIMKPHVRPSGVLYRRVFHSMFDISRLDSPKGGPEDCTA